VLIKGDCEVKVVDFGIAKQLAHGRGTFNQFQSVPYSSPERLRTGDVDLQSDLWAVAVMLYEMVAGGHPFSAPLNMIRMRTLDGNGPDPLPKTCPVALRNVILRALACSPSDRYPSAAAMAEDLERYLNGQAVQSPPVTDPNATVRTVRLKPPEPPPLPPHLRKRSVHDLVPFLNRHREEVRLIAAGVALFVMVAMGHAQWVVHRHSVEARRELLSGHLSIDDGWDKFVELQKSTWVPLLLFGLQDTLKSKLMDRGSEPIADYRQDQPTATLTDWERAQDDLLRYLQIDPRSRIAKGRELICEGQIARFHAYTHGRLNQKLLSQAIGHFEQAAELMPDSPDPYLAMAPVYLYYEQDYDRGMAMQNAAVKRGHVAGKRETAQLADTLKANGRREMTLAIQFQDNPDRKKQHLESAISAFDSSVEYYGQISGFAGSSQGLREAILGRQQAQKMLDQMETN
jgi:hypothetical protein